MRRRKLKWLWARLAQLQDTLAIRGNNLGATRALRPFCSCSTWNIPNLSLRNLAPIDRIPPPRRAEGRELRAQTRNHQLHRLS